MPGRDAVVVLGHDIWQQQFGGDPQIVGRAVRLDGLEFTVIGVVPASFAGPYKFVRIAFYAPLMMWPRLSADPEAYPLDTRVTRKLTIKGRLRPGVTQSEAQTELALIGRNLERMYPDTNRNRDFVVRTELQTRMAHDRPTR